MTTALETAFPLSSNWNAPNVRAKLAEAMIGVFDTASLSGEDFAIQPYPVIAVYGPDGDLSLYAYDAGDTTTADDGGTTCIVVSGRRYKRTGELIIRDAAISATTTAQPVSPSFGDTYIVPSAPSGSDWSAKAETVATYTARGWIFRQPFVGMMVYVEDEDAIYHYDSTGDWIKGLPVGALQDGSITPKTLAHPFAILAVEDERNSPPGSAPTTGTMYQVGTSPTGGFAGNSGKIARYNGSGYDFLSPHEGATIYRKDAGTLYSYRSGAWVQTIAPSAVSKMYAASASGTGGNMNSLTDLLSKSITVAASEGTHIKVDILTFTGTLQIQGGVSIVTAELGVRIDTSSSFSGDTDKAQGGSSTVQSAVTGNVTLLSDGTTVLPGLMRRSFVVAVPDTSAHTYSIAIRRSDGSQNISLSNWVLAATFSVVRIEP